MDGGLEGDVDGREERFLLEDGGGEDEQVDDNGANEDLRGGLDTPALQDNSENFNESVPDNSINKFTFLLTNARSLAPKLESFFENFSERDVDLCVVTETWLSCGPGLLQDDSVDLRLGVGIGALHCGREDGR